ncbi:MAG TPA: tRNA threonylcarbamoyladenosine dehydratase, partial [Flavobacteriales bacterium]|nr:tRNA threonylcarbamoyladenosine dehydratase [Flavobacteriales bacterium]
KTAVVAERLLDINPALKLHIKDRFLEPDDFEALLSETHYDYVVDAIDSVSPKIYLILAAKRQKIKIVSAMGAGGKTDPSKVKVADISKTRDDFLARVIRKRLRKHGIQKGVKCVFSTELQQADSLQMTDNTNFKKSHYGTISYMPALFGLQAAATVINYLTKS